MVSRLTGEPLRQAIASRPKTRTRGPLALAIIFQLLILLAAIVWVVVVPDQSDEPAFTSGKTVYLPQRELEHRMAVAEFHSAAPSPVTIERLSAEALIPRELPALPAMPVTEFNPLSRSEMASAGQSLLGQSGLVGALQALDTVKSDASFFGIEDSGRRILVMLDDGGSVLNKARASGVPIERIKEEAIELIEGLNANTLFGLIRFVRKIETFQTYLIPATMSNKEAAIEWINHRFGMSSKHTSLSYSRSGVEGALELAFRLEPDVIFLLSDADFQRNEAGMVQIGPDRVVPFADIEDTIKAGQDALEEEARLHFVGFQVPELLEREMKSIVRRNEGRYRNIE